MSNFKCSVCEDPVVAPGICVDCGRQLGLFPPPPPLPPPRRPAAPCTRCSHLKFLRVVDWSSSLVAVPSVRIVRTGLSGTPERITDYEDVGKLELYVCKKCGLVETYCQDVERVPVGPQFRTDVVDYESDSPYR